jgi:hypothetical protein
LHYKRKATPNGKQNLPRAVLARQRACFVALEFILRKRRLVMVNAGFRFTTAHERFFSWRMIYSENWFPLSGIMRGTATGR